MEFPFVGRAVFAFVKEGDSELELTEGEIVLVKSVAANDWALGCKENGEEGFFPMHYVEEIPDTDGSHARDLMAAALAARGGADVAAGGAAAASADDVAVEQLEPTEPQQQEEENIRGTSSSSSSQHQQVQHTNPVVAAASGSSGGGGGGDDDDEWVEAVIEENAVDSDEEKVTPTRPVQQQEPEEEEELLVIKCLDTGQSIPLAVVEHDLEVAEEKLKKLQKQQQAGARVGVQVPTHKTDLMLSLFRVEDLPKRPTGPLASHHTPTHAVITVSASGVTLAEVASPDAVERYEGAFLTFPCTPITITVPRDVWRVLLRVEIRRRELHHQRMHVVSWGTAMLDQREPNAEERIMPLAKPKNKLHRERGKLYYLVVW